MNILHDHATRRSRWKSTGLFMIQRYERRLTVVKRLASPTRPQEAAVNAEPPAEGRPDPSTSPT